MLKFEDLKLINIQENENIEWEEQKIEVKQYLPIQEKLNLITTIINDSIDENGFYNPAKIYVFLILETIDAFTNIEFTDEQKENPGDTYDLLVSTGLSAKIFEQINPYEYQQIKSWVYETVDSIYKYKNSALGILEAVNEDYKDADFDAEKIREKLASQPEEIQTLKDIMDKLG